MRARLTSQTRWNSAELTNDILLVPHTRTKGAIVHVLRNAPTPSQKLTLTLDLSALSMEVSRQRSIQTQAKDSMARWRDTYGIVLCQETGSSVDSDDKRPLSWPRYLGRVGHSGCVDKDRVSIGLQTLNLYGPPRLPYR